MSKLTGAHIVLRDARTASSWSTPPFPGAPTSVRPNIAVDAGVVADKRPSISDVFIDRATGRPVFAVVVPVVYRGKLRYLLSMQAPTERIAALLTKGVVGQWVIGIGDRKGDYVTRVPGHDAFSGKPGVPAFLALAKGVEGNFRGNNPYGGEILVGYAHTSLGDWLVAASMPSAVIEAPLRDQLVGFLGFGLLTLAVSIFLVFWLWRVASRPLRLLTGRGVSTADAMRRSTCIRRCARSTRWPPI